MCGIFGYIGAKNAPEVILEGLKRLEYRGYDSWGIAILADQIQVDKKVGAIGDFNYINLPKSNIGIGHTRWATHGGITEVNAHPHFSSDKSFCLGHNGIVENYQTLKDQLKKEGFKFETQTDTEVIVRLIEKNLKIKKDLVKAVQAAFLVLKGRNTVIILTKDNKIIALRNGSPLVVGLGSQRTSGEASEVFLSSDTLSFAPYVEKILVVDNGQMVICQGNNVDLLDIKTGKPLPITFEKLDLKSSKVDKEGYDHFMIKEIQESGYVLQQLLNQISSRHPKGGSMNYDNFISALKEAKNIYTIGSGTAGIAASQIAFYLRTLAKINAISLVGADATDYLNLWTEKDLIIAPSQSGETADVLEVLEIAKEKKLKIASYVNMQGSTMSRISDYKFLSHAGPEISVVSTKVFTSQIAWGYLIAKLTQGQEKEAIKNLQMLLEKIDIYLNTQTNHKITKDLAKKLAKSKDIFLLGKGQNFNMAKEGMVKIIEGSYIHAHAIPAGDLKHYAITLMQKGVPVIAPLSEDHVKDEVVNALNEVKARGATVIGVASKLNSSFDHYIPVPETGETSAIMNIIPLQLLAYYMAIELGHNVDKPRNIAKSVTVK